MKVRTLLLVITGLSVSLGSCLGLKRQVIGPVISSRLLNQLRSGMSMQDVEALLGEPSRRQRNNFDTYPTSETWIYERTLNVGHVEVFFDHAGTLSSINDESAFPGKYPFSLSE